MIKTLYFYANKDDYLLISSFLADLDTIHIDTTPRKDIGVKIVNNCNEVNVVNEIVLLNCKIKTIKEYASCYHKIKEYYHYANSGSGVIQLLKCEINNGHLQYGRMSASFDDSDEKTKKWVNKVFSWIRKIANKVYRTRENLTLISDFTERNFYCLPNAGKEFDGSNGRFLWIVNEVYGIAEPIKIVHEKLIK